MADSKAQEAAQNSEDLAIPPPPYEEASEAGSTDSFQLVTATQQEEKPPVPPKIEHESTSNTQDSERVPEYQPSEYYQPIRDEKQPLAHPETPLLPSQPYTTASGIPTTFTFTWTRPWTDHPTLLITPSTPLPSLDPTTPPIAQWRLNYQKKYFARLHRYGANHVNGKIRGDFPMRQIAEVKFPEFKWTFGPTITFEPHEEEIDRRGARHVSRTDRFMHCTGWFTTRYGIDLPVLNGARCEWRVGREGEIEAKVRDLEAGQGEGSEKGPSDDAKEQAQPAAAKPAQTPAEMFEQARKVVLEDSWTPYPTQEFVEEVSGKVLATYTRSAPWSRRSGMLEIARPEGIQITPEYIEGVVIAAAAMACMQDRIGLASALFEAGAESYIANRAKNAKNKACDCAREGEGRLPLEPIQTQGRTEREKTRPEKA